MKLSRLLVLSSLALTGCFGEIPATNPYDPSTPVEQQQKATLSGTVSGSGGALTGAVLSLSGPTSPANNPITTAADGAFNFGELTPGVYSLTVEHPSHFTAFRDLILTPGEGRVLELTLAALGDDAATSGHLTGVVHKSGELARPAALQDHSGVIVELSGTGVRTVSNREGRFDLFVNDGTYDVTFDAPEYDRAERSGVVVLAGETTEVPSSPVVLDPNPGAIVGRVYLEGKDATASLHGGTIVSVAGTSATTQTAPDGSFRLDDLAAGTYTLIANKSDPTITYVTGTQVVVVRGGEDTSVQDMTLAVARGRVTGTVSLLGEDDSSGVTVTLSGTTYSGISNADGDFAIEGVPVGTYDLEARKQSYSPAGESGVSVEAGVTTTLGAVLVLSKQTGDFQINDGAPYTNDEVVTLELDVTNAFQMMISEDPTFMDSGLGDVTYRAYDAAPVFTLSGGGLPAGDGVKTIYVQTRDAALSVQGVLQATITLDTQPPTNVSVVINGGDEFSNDDQGIVTLAITATDATSGVKDYQAVNDGVFTVSGWKPFEASATHVLGTPATQEEKTVSLKVRDYAGNETVAAVTDTVELDYTPPQITTFTVSCPGALVALKCASEIVGLTIAGTDGPAGIGEVVYMALANESGFSGSAFEGVAPSRSWLLSPGDGAKTVRLKLMDGAGNVSDEASVDLSLDTTPPEDVSVTINGALAGNDGASTSYTSVPGVTLTLGGTDGASGTGLTKVWVANDPSFAAASFLDYGTTISPWTLSPTTGEVLTSVYVRVADAAGNITASSGSITLDTVPPLPGFTLDSSFVTGGTVDATLNASGAAEMCFWGDITGGSTDACDDDGWETYSPTTTLNLTSGETTKLIRARFRDAAHNRSDANPSARSVTRDGTAPDISGAAVTIRGLAAGGSSTSLTRVPNVTVSFTGATENVSSVTDMMVSEDSSFSGAAWQSVATSFPWVLSAGDDTKRVYIRLRDGAGNSTSTSMMGSIVLDQTAPTGATLALDDTDTDEPGDVYTKRLPLDATLSATGASAVCFLGPVSQASTDGCGASGWISPVPSTQPLTLVGAEGTKVITAFFRDDAGNATSPVSDSIVLDLTAPAPVTINSLSPRTTSVFVDMDDSGDGGSGVASYKVYYGSITDGKRCNQQKLSGSATFTGSEGWIGNLAAPKLYKFCPIAIDGAGNVSDALPMDPGELSGDAVLVGMNVSIIDALGRAGTFGDRVLSGRGFTLFPAMADSQTLSLVSCDMRTKRCQDAGFVNNVLNLGPAPGLNLCANPAGDPNPENEVAITQQGADVWMFVMCPSATTGEGYRVVAMRSPSDASETPELDTGSAPADDVGKWRLVNLGTATPATRQLGESASAAANGSIIALAFAENVAASSLRVTMCRNADDCTDPAQWSSVALPLLGPPVSYTSLEAGPDRLWLAHARPGAVDVLRCITGRSTGGQRCEDAGGWSTVTLPNPGVEVVYAARSIEVAGSLYVMALQRVSGNNGLYMWRCDPGTTCGDAAQIASPVNVLAQPLGAAVGGGGSIPRLAFEFADGYLYYAAVDYLTGDVIYARCKGNENCTDVTKWAPSTVFSTSTISGQADLTVVGGNPMVFLSRDPNNTYVLEPNTPAPFGRALIPDFENGGARASVTPRDPDSIDGYAALYNTSGFSSAFSESVISFEPANEGFAVAGSPTSTYYGFVAALNGNDQSFADPRFSARTGAPIEISASTSMKLQAYAATASCHVVAWVDGALVRAAACATSGDCTALTATQTLMTLPSAPNGMAVTTTGSTVHVVASGTFGAGNHNLRWTTAALDASCNVGTPASAIDLYNPALAAAPTEPSIATNGPTVVVAHANATNLAAIARCHTGCGSAANWGKYDMGETSYRGGDLLVEGSRMFWAANLGASPPSETRIRRCDLGAAQPVCASPASWTASVSLKGQAFGAGDLSYQDTKLLWSHGGRLWTCRMADVAIDCTNKYSWSSYSVTAETLSAMDPGAGILGSVNNDLLFAGYSVGGISLQRCADRCWDSDSWYGGFVGRGSRYAAVLWIPGAYLPTGAFGAFGSSGELFATYRYVKTGESYDAPKSLRINDGAQFGVQLAP